MAAIFSKGLGFTVRHINVTMANCKALLMDSGLQEWLADEFLEMFAEIRDGKFAFTTHFITEQLCNTRAISFYEFVTAHKDRFTSARPIKPVRDFPEGVPDSVQYPRISAAGTSEALVKEVNLLVEDAKILLDRASRLQKALQ